MKRNPLLLLVLAVFLALLAPRPAGASVSFDFFYENLSPHGEWVEADGYGTCWRPLGIDAEWAPYTDGYWVYTDAGWTWVSYEDFGSITYHYGRWVRIDGYGWIWKPDYEWAPAWVSWRYSDDYVGWAPLPPEAHWDSGVGISIWADRDYDIGPGYYSFCETRHFGAPVLRNVLLGRSLNITIINKTKNVTNITYRKNKTVYSGGPDYRRISGRSHRRIETLKLERRTDWNRKEKPRNHRVGNGLVVAAPYIEKSRPSSRPPRVSRRIEKPKVDKGWNSIADASARNRTREKIREEAKGLSRKNAPARPVDDRAFEEAARASRERKGDQDRKENKGNRFGASQPKEEGQRVRQSEDRVDRNRREGEQRQRDEQRKVEQGVRQREEAEREGRERERQQRQRNEDRDREQAEQRREKNQREQAERGRREAEQRQRNDRAAERNLQRAQEQADRARRESDRDRRNERSRNEQSRNDDRGRQNERSRGENRERENDRGREKSEKKQNRSSESSEKKKKKD